MAASQHWRPRLIALDIDGTLCPEGPLITAPSTADAVTEPVRVALAAAANAGAHVVLCSGRTVIGIRPFLTELGVATKTAICSNGSVWVDVPSATVCRQHDFNPAEPAKLLAELLPGAVFIAEEVGIGNRTTAPLDLDTFFGHSRLVDFAGLIASPTPRMSVLWPGHSQAELAATMAGVEIPGVHYSLDHTEACLMATAAGVTKGSALEALRVQLDVSADATMAIGDGHNDVEMLAWAAHGVAMGQAPASVRAIADEVTAPLSEDGVAHALSRWFD